MYKIFATLILLASICGGVFYYYTSTQSKIETLTKNNAILETNIKTVERANEETVKTVDTLVKGFDRVKEDFDFIQDEFQSIRSDNKTLQDRFDGSDLGALAEARPNLIENIINNASDEAGRCFEILTGSPLTQSERNAENARQFNSECPFLWPGNASSQ